MEKKVKKIIREAWENLSGDEVLINDLLKEVQKKLPHMTENDLLDFITRNPIFD